MSSYPPSSRRDPHPDRDPAYSSGSEDGEIGREDRSARKKRTPDRCYDDYEESDRYRDRDYYYSSRTDHRRHQHRHSYEPREAYDDRRYEHRPSSYSRRDEERPRSKRKNEESDHRHRHRHRDFREEDRDEGHSHKLPNDDLRNRIKKRHHENINPERDDRESGKSEPASPVAADEKIVIKKAATLVQVEEVDASDEEVLIVPIESENNHQEEGKSESRNHSPVVSTSSTPHMEEVQVDEAQADLSDEPESGDPNRIETYFPAIQGCRNVEEFQRMNKIEEGTYGIVFRAKCKKTGKIVALKRLKMEKEREGFPITSLREINTLMKAPHENIVRVIEIVVGGDLDKIYIVMEFVEHDLKSLMEQMKKPFLAGEVKTLMIQLLSAIAHLHDNWILHRDLKTSNLLLSHRGVLKVGDFGLAREYGSPLKEYTPVVVTLWYRAPELLLEAPKYSTPIDVWSIGCIFGELLTMRPFFPGKSEIDQLNLIFKDLGTPRSELWPDYPNLPLVKKVTFPMQPYNKLRDRVKVDKLSDLGLDLMMRFLAYCPERRISAVKALKHEYFRESPKPVETWAFPTWPARSEGSARPKHHSPKAPVGGKFAERVAGENDDILMGNYRGAGFSLKF